MGLIYSSIRVRDMDKAIEFYSKFLGMKEAERRSPIPGELVVVLESPDTKNKLQLMYYEKKCKMYKDYEKGDEMDHLMFEVEDANETFKRLVAGGAEIAMNIFEIRDGRFMGFVKDRDGIWVGVISSKKK
jgi:lactoylglutathione lyase